MENLETGWIEYSDWKNIDIISNEYRKLEGRYIDAFDEGIPLCMFSKDITFEELTREVNTAIDEGIELFEKYNPDFKPLDFNDPEVLNNLKLY